MHPTTLFWSLVSILYGNKQTNAEKDTQIPISQQLSKFANLLDVVGHCSFVSIQSHHESTCNLKHQESFCNKFTKSAQQQYGSAIISFTANSTFSLWYKSIGRLPLAKRWAPRCTVWIQYDKLSISLEFTRLKPDVFIFYSDLDALQYEFERKDAQKWQIKAYWLRAIEAWFTKPMVMIHTNPKSTVICILCIYCSSREIIALPVVVNHVPQISISIIFFFIHEKARKNLHLNSIYFGHLDYVNSHFSKLVKNTCYQYPVRFSVDPNICAMLMLSQRFNFTLTTFKTLNSSSTIFSKEFVTSNNLIVHRAWLSFYTDTDQFAFMSLSLHTKITLSDVFFQPLALSSWLLVTISAIVLLFLLSWANLLVVRKGFTASRLVSYILLVSKNLIDQPTSDSDTNGLRFRLNTLVLCLWCFCCMHANHLYKAAVFSGSHFQEKNEYPTNTNEMVKSFWPKYTTSTYLNDGNVSTQCMLHFLSNDMGNKSHLINEITEDLICDMKFDNQVVYATNTWALSDNRLRMNNSIKFQNLILVNPVGSLHRIKLGLNALNTEIKMSHIYKIHQFTVPTFWVTERAGLVTSFLSDGLRIFMESGLKVFWEKHFDLNYNVEYIDSIFGMYKNLNGLSKGRPSQKAGSYILVLANGKMISPDYEPIPKSVYLEGAKYVSVFIFISVVTFIFECVSGKRLSLLQLKCIYWSNKLYVIYFFNILVLKVKILWDKIMHKS